MRKVIILYAALVLMVFDAFGSDIKMRFNGNRPDTVVVDANSFADACNGITSVDWKRVTVCSDEIVLRVDDDEVMKVVVWPDGSDTNSVTVIIGPGESVEIIVDNGDFRKASVGGTEFMDAVSDYRKAVRTHQAQRSEDASGDILMDQYVFSSDYALSHRNEDIGVWAMQYMPLAMSAQIIDSIGSQARTGMLQPLYDLMATRAAGFKKSIEIKKRNESGGKAPDFTLRDEEGNKVSLSDFRGRWVLLDFWATWCKWCVKGFPALTDFVEKYSDRCVVIALSVDYHEETWKNYLSGNRLPWINLWVDPTDHSDSNPKDSYAVDSLPTEFLISPEGNIVRYAVGENEDFLEAVRRDMDAY